MPTFEEVYRLRKERIDRIPPDSVHAYYEIMVARFILLAASVPFALGMALAYWHTGKFHFWVFLVGSIAVYLIMGAVNAGNTYYDYETDLQNWDFSIYSGGIRVLVENKITNRRRALYFAIGLMVAALPLGLSLRFVFGTGPWTIPLGLFGALAGWFYTGWPLKLVYRGLGELVIAVCSGMLTVVSGYYLQTGRFDPVVVPYALGLAFTILNVILINEFPDAPSDARAGKRTFLVRFGKEVASRVYLANWALALVCFLSAPLWGAPWWSVALPLALAAKPAAQNVRRILRREHLEDINDTTLTTFTVHFTLELWAMVALFVGGLLRWGLGWL